MNAPTNVAALAPTVKLLIGGQFVESQTTEWRDVVNPATQQVLARVPFATQNEIDAAVASAKAAFKTWKKTPIGARARIFLKYQQLIRENMAELAAMLTAEQGKTLPDAEGDVFRGLEVVEHAASIGNLQLGELANNVASGVDTYTLLQPLGVCAGITPFNFPAMIPLWMFPMAIATGNTFVLKPSEQDPMVTMRLVELAMEAGIPAGVLNVIHGGEMAVNALCDHKDIKAVSFGPNLERPGRRRLRRCWPALHGAVGGGAGGRGAKVDSRAGRKNQDAQGQRRHRKRHRRRPADLLRRALARGRPDRARHCRGRQA